jgi:membrane-bound metal-dependent hydrolase YbcI (DUF457 family)
MMLKTHIAIGIFLMLLLMPVVVYKISFGIIIIICTLLPDIDMSQSYLGKNKFLRPLQWVVKHRGVFHSFTFALIITFGLMFYYPIFALPFFLGYSGHLIGDALTPEGIRPWWPFKYEIKWKIRTGGKREKTTFYIILVCNLLLLLRLIYY